MMKTKILFLLLIISSCTLFDDKEKKAINICQQAENNSNIFHSETWLNYENQVAKDNPNKKYHWTAKETGEANIYLVAFIDQDNWGDHWEVNIASKIVRDVNSDDYLSEKYGYKSVDTTDFSIDNINQQTFSLKKQSDADLDLSDIFEAGMEGKSINRNENQIYYTIRATVLNKTDKLITSAKIDGKLRLIFKDKTITSESNHYSGFKEDISEDNPWKPNTTRSFYIKTKGIAKLYLNYSAPYILFNVSLKANDPTDYSFEHDITEYDLKDAWKKLGK